MYTIRQSRAPTPAQRGQSTPHTVTWDVSNPPTDITNPIGSIKLRKDGITFLTLASGFNILLGQYEVTVPYVAESSEYILVLMGDSGNRSPGFTIRGSPSQCPV
ncbi:hypothetical protein EDD85DRAFT_1003038 [Armillaria nabsnona]|nr:hypothetical protein EDD85DRAFT_1003038 [Armillaria nabsnona]